MKNTMKNKVLHRQELREPYLKNKKVKVERIIEKLIPYMIKDIALSVKEDMKR